MFLDDRCHQKVDRISKNADSFAVHAVDRKGTNISYQARMIVFATGIFDHPKKIGAEGEKLPKVMHYYNFKKRMDSCPSVL